MVKTRKNHVFAKPSRTDHFGRAKIILASRRYEKMYAKSQKSRTRTFFIFDPEEKYLCQIGPLFFVFFRVF